MVPISGRPSTPASRRVPSMPNCGPGFASANVVGQAEVEQAEAGELLELEEVARHRRDQVRQRRPHVRDRPGQGDAALAVRLVGAAGAGQRGAGDRAEVFERHHARGGALLELGRLAGERQEGAGGLLAGHRLGGLGQRPGGLDPVVGLDAGHRGQPPATKRSRSTISSRAAER